MKRLKHGNIRSGSEIIKTFEVSCNTVHTGYGCCQSDDCILAIRTRVKASVPRGR